MASGSGHNRSSTPWSLAPARSLSLVQTPGGGLPASTKCDHDAAGVRRGTVANSRCDRSAARSSARTDIARSRDQRASASADAQGTMSRGAPSGTSRLRAAAGEAFRSGLAAGRHVCRSAGGIGLAAAAHTRRRPTTSADLEHQEPGGRRPADPRPGGAGGQSRELALPAENLLTPEHVRRLAWQPPNPPTAEAIDEALRRSALGPGSGN